MKKEFAVPSEKVKTRKGNMRPTATGFSVEGGNYLAVDLARYARTRKRRREAAETRIGAATATKTRARLAARLDAAIERVERHDDESDLYYPD